MTSVGVGAAKTNLSALLRKVEQGEEIIIERGGVAVAKLVRMDSPGRVFGSARGTVTVPEDFDTPLPDDVLELFAG